MTLRELTDLKERQAKLKDESAHAQGRLDALLAQLKAEFGVATLRDGEKLLVKLGDEQKQAEQEYQQLITEFETNYKDKLSAE